MSLTPIFDELAEKFGITIPDPIESDPVHELLADGPITQVMPLVPAEPVTQSIPVVRPAEDISWADGLVAPSWNGLRPEDAALPQPPQDPSWRPSAIG